MNQITKLLKVFADKYNSVSLILRIALGLVFTNVVSNGLAIFTQYGQLLLLLVGTMLTMALIVNPLIIFLYLHRNPYPSGLCGDGTELCR